MPTGISNKAEIWPATGAHYKGLGANLDYRKILKISPSKYKPPKLVTQKPVR